MSRLQPVQRHPIQALHRAILLAVMIAINPAAAQVGSFDSGSDGSDGPLFIAGSLPPIEDFSVVYDAARGELVAFGGDSYIDHAGNRTTYVFDGNAWRTADRGTGPSTRDNPGMVYDTVRQEVLLFDGDGGSDDTWTWDGTTWTEVTPEGSPTPYNMALAFDQARGQAVLVSQASFSSDTLETWTWDGSSWTLQAPSTPLPYRNNFRAIYDPDLQRVVLVARNSSSDYHTFLWDGTDWSQVTTDTVDLDPFDGDLAWIPHLGGIVFLSNSDFIPSMVFTGENWEALGDVPYEFSDDRQGLVYFPPLEAVLGLNPNIRVEVGRTQRNDTWAWYADGSVEKLVQGTYAFDMRGRPGGVWNFTTIEIGPNVVVTFIPNENNTPVHWLASGEVFIDGILDISGSERSEDAVAAYAYPNALGGHPGPGGFKGAIESPLGWELPVFGDGPGDGNEFDSYGNPLLYPLVGGSGQDSYEGVFPGGGGGGAIQIASSEDLILRGTIRALGGRQVNSSADVYGGDGAVLLRANRLLGDGTIDAGNGWIRLEGWERELAEYSSGSYFPTHSSDGFPLLPTDTLSTRPRLWVESIGGVAVAYPRSHPDSLVEPDTIIDTTGPVAIVVKAENIPDSSEVLLQVRVADGSLLELGPVSLSGGQAVFNVELPKGFGAIEAKVSYPYNP